MPVTDIRGLKTKNRSSMSMGTILRMLAALPKMPYYARQSAKEYGKRYRSELLQLMFENIIGPDYSATALVFTLATLASGNGGYPEGGSLSMALRMAKKFETLGGKIRYGMSVNRVSVRHGIADGIVVNDELVPSDAVIVTRDTLSAIDDLFDFPIREPWAERMRRVTKPLLNTFICLGIEVDLKGLPERMDFVSMRPLMCGGKEEQVIKICNYAGYEGYAPDGCTALTSAIIGDTYDYWKARKEDGTYGIEKEKLARDFIKILSEKFPQTAEKTVVWDVATPLTYERYLKSFKGSWMTVATKGHKMEYYPSKPENIRNLYFAGQRLRAPGGLPVALDSGRRAVQFLCKDYGMVFGQSEKSLA
jgi:phytoene dehydrogenase-like protein